MGIRIREVTKEDIENFAQLVLNFKNEHSHMIGGEGIFMLDDAMEEVRRYLARDDTGYFVALDSSDKLIGFRRWELHDDFYFTRELYIIPDARRRGIAKALVRHFEKWVIEKGQDIASISCTPHNIAMIALVYSEGYDILNMIEMRKNLSSNLREPRSETEVLGMKWKIL